MAHRDATTDADDAPTVYDQGGSVDADPDAKQWWADDLDHRLNLRIPEWMFTDLEQYSDYQQEKISETAREMLEYALMSVDFNSWSGINAFGRHSYGDLKCPACAETHGLRLRWSKQREGFTVAACRSCDAQFTIEEGRAAKNLDRPLANLWFMYAFRDETAATGDDLVPEFEAFLDDPRAFLEAVEWNDELTAYGRAIEDMKGNPQTERETALEYLAAWEESATESEAEAGTDDEH